MNLLSAVLEGNIKGLNKTSYMVWMVMAQKKVKVQRETSHCQYGAA